MSSVWVELMLRVLGTFKKPPLGRSQVLLADLEHAMAALIREVLSAVVV